MDEPTWVPRIVVDSAHTNQLQEHGGLQGIRDVNALESALARPQHKYAYDPEVDVAQLAAAYAYGIATSHPYADGNKRTAFVIAMIFLELNGSDLNRSEEEVVATMRAMANHHLSEIDLGTWFRTALMPLTASGVDAAKTPIAATGSVSGKR